VEILAIIINLYYNVNNNNNIIKFY